MPMIVLAVSIGLIILLLKTKKRST